MAGFPHWYCFDERWSGLEHRRSNAHSQFGEDGIIGAIFDQIGTRNQWCLEIGASDGDFYSNTKKLRDAGWHAVLIEAEEQSFTKLLRYQSDRVKCVWCTATSVTIDQYLQHYSAPANLDFVSIDVDGQDYHLWDGMKSFRPRLVCIEFDYRAGESETIPAVGGRGQAGLVPLRRLGQSKGYRLICGTYCNLFFLEKDAECQS